MQIIEKYIIGSFIEFIALVVISWHSHSFFFSAPGYILYSDIIINKIPLYSILTFIVVCTRIVRINFEYFIKTHE
jgi:hypothetical protein